VKEILTLTEGQAMLRGPQLQIRRPLRGKWGGAMTFNKMTLGRVKFNKGIYELYSLDGNGLFISMLWKNNVIEIGHSSGAVFTCNTL